MRAGGRAALHTSDKKYDCCHPDCCASRGRPVPLASIPYQRRHFSILQDVLNAFPPRQHNRNRNTDAPSFVMGPHHSMGPRSLTPPGGRPFPAAAYRRAGVSDDDFRMRHVCLRLAGATGPGWLPPSTRRGPLPEFRRALRSRRAAHHGRLGLGEDGRSCHALRREDPPARKTLRGQPGPAASLLATLPGGRGGASGRWRARGRARATADPRRRFPRLDCAPALSILPALGLASLQLPAGAAARSDRARSQLRGCRP